MYTLAQVLVDVTHGIQDHVKYGLCLIVKCEVPWENARILACICYLFVKHAKNKAMQESVEYRLCVMVNCKAPW